MAAMIDGPRLPARNGAARTLVVFLHGYGADGNDLIDIGPDVAAVVARGGLRGAARPFPLRPGAGGARVVSADLP